VCMCLPVTRTPLRVQLGFDLTAELVVAGVAANSPAAAAGLQRGQRFLYVDECPVTTLDDVMCVPRLLNGIRGQF